MIPLVLKAAADAAIQKKKKKKIKKRKSYKIINNFKQRNWRYNENTSTTWRIGITNKKN